MELQYFNVKDIIKCSNLFKHSIIMLSHQNIIMLKCFNVEEGRENKKNFVAQIVFTLI
jgi:hypothetical protein